MILGIRPLVGGATVMTEDGTMSLPLIFLKVDALAAGKGLEDVAADDSEADEVFRFVIPSPGLARRLATQLVKAAERVERGR